MLGSEYSQAGNRKQKQQNTFERRNNNIYLWMLINLSVGSKLHVLMIITNVYKTLKIIDIKMTVKQLDIFSEISPYLRHIDNTKTDVATTREHNQ